jgi:hypothetical protein
MQFVKCEKLGQDILVSDEDYEGLKDKYIGWNGRRGAYFYATQKIAYVNQKKIYVHRWVYAQMLPEEDRWLLEGKNVGFRDRDPSNCQRNNLFVWQSDSEKKADRAAAKREALEKTLELERELQLQNASARG